MTQAHLPTMFQGLHVEEKVLELERIHGPGRFKKGDNGWEMLLPSPELLLADPNKELKKRCLAFNISKLQRRLELQYRPADKTEVRDPRWGQVKDWDQVRVGYCIKSHKTFSYRELTAYPTLEVRLNNPDAKALAVKLGGQHREDDPERLLEHCHLVPGLGWIPKPAGEIIPARQWPADNIGAGYLRSRGYTDFGMMQDHLGMGWCVQHREGYPAYYKDDVFPITPQGRITFECWKKGNLFLWQGRIPERVNEQNELQLWHPYENDWVSIGEKLPGEAPHFFSPWEDERKLPVQKYLFPTLSERSKVILGLEAAMAHKRVNAQGMKLAVLVEGPLDAARLGPPAVCCMGLYISETQFQLLNNNFDHICVIEDNDPSGPILSQQALKAKTNAKSRLSLSRYALPQTFKDVGEVPDSQVPSLWSALTHNFSPISPQRTTYTP